MTASNPGTIEYGLRIEGDYYNHLDIEGFSLMMKILLIAISSTGLRQS